MTNEIKTTKLEGEYEIRLAWSFNTNDRKLSIEEFYNKASDKGATCSASNILNNLKSYPYVIYRLALVSLNNTYIKELTAGSYLKLYTGIIEF